MQGAPAVPDTTDLVSPLNGAPLLPCGPGLLTDGERRWPVVAGIPWLRTGREEVRERAAGLLARGDVVGAAVALLADTGGRPRRLPPSAGRLCAVLGAPTLRQAVRLLGMGRDGEYLLHRWSDPAWAAVLALTAHHPPGELPVLEPACGAGHLLRELALRGHREPTGLDADFAQLWLARRFVAPGARLVCADLTAPWPLVPRGPAYVACHAALHLLPEGDRREVVRRARLHADGGGGGGGGFVLGHCRTAPVPGPGAGPPPEPADWQALLPRAVCYDTAELADALLGAVRPTPRSVRDPAGSGTVALADTPPPPPGHRPEEFLRPVPGRPLRPNPLYRDGRLHWPGERWRAGHGPRAAAYPPARVALSDRVLADALAGRPTPAVADLFRRRVLLDLPERW